ncbi:MAG: zinc ribbon domain-containing protein [Chloroflexi bacterium]|nr:zinc ribbon domain-containing protein [Chloroflexota bacterium]
MPTYEYSCPSCKKSYELRESFSAESTHKCHHCGKGTAKRVLHAPRVVFKGSGFYVTDSRGKNSAMADNASPAESTPEAKPAATPPPAPSGGSKPEAAAAS